LASNRSTRRAVYAALIGNLLVLITKLAAALWTGSAAMLSEAVHSLIDCANELLLLHGMRRAARPPDRTHPLGYGRELYFWSFIVAILIFALGAGLSMLEGVHQLRVQTPMEHPAANYIVLGLSFLFELGSWYVSLQQFRAAKGTLSYWQAIRRSKDAPSFLVLFENTTDLVGLLLAFAGIAAAQYFDAPILDGAASILIGLMLAVTATILAREIKGLLIGERADQEIADAILRLASDIPGVCNANGIITVHLAPDQIVAVLSLEFDDDLTTPDIEQRVVQLEDKVRAACAQVTTLFVKPQSRGGWRERHERRFGTG
jgi:cation diffusion facilitator family transporter